MAEKSYGSLRLPRFRQNEKQKRWIAGERRTANLICALWEASRPDQREDPAFLQLLVQLGWNNGDKGESTRRWRNRKIADYLNASYSTDQQLAADLHSQFRSISISRCLRSVRDRTGITRYYTAYRPATLALVKEHSEDIALAFNQVSAKSGDVHKKVRRVAGLIESLGEFRVGDKTISPFKGLTPALSCLDPQQTFPIMNRRTHALLDHIGKEPDKEGLVAISRLIGPNHNIRDARELDVYASSEHFPKPIPRAAAHVPHGFKDIGLKSEINSFGQIAAKRTTIRKLHNELVNRLNDYLLWRHIMAKESRFDALLIEWKKGRDLLIEAKTSSDGTTGRAQVRQAIGQLYDYRFTFMPNKNVDLAILLPREPKSDVRDLLHSLGIELVWFKGKKLAGTIRL